MMETFIGQIRKALTRASATGDTSGYLDLAAAEKQLTPEEFNTPLYPPDILISFQEIIMREIHHCNLDKTLIGINELLKYLLASLDKENEPYLAERFLDRLRLIFKRCLMPDYPFPEEVWNYTCACLRSTGSYLMENGFYIATREIIDFLAGSGRIAGLKGLPTANTQSSLRILENKALEKNEKHLASVAKNARFNLEI